MALFRDILGRPKYTSECEPPLDPPERDDYWCKWDCKEHWAEEAAKELIAGKDPEGSEALYLLVRYSDEELDITIYEMVNDFMHDNDAGKVNDLLMALFTGRGVTTTTIKNISDAFKLYVYERILMLADKAEKRFYD